MKIRRVMAFTATTMMLAMIAASLGTFTNDDIYNAQETTVNKNEEDNTVLSTEDNSSITIGDTETVVIVQTPEVMKPDSDSTSVNHNHIFSSIKPIQDVMEQFPIKEPTNADTDNSVEEEKPSNNQSDKVPNKDDEVVSKPTPPVQQTPSDDGESNTQEPTPSIPEQGEEDKVEKPESTPSDDEVVEDEREEAPIDEPTDNPTDKPVEKPEVKPEEKPSEIPSTPIEKPTFPTIKPEQKPEVKPEVNESNFLASVEQEIFKIVNQERIANGLPALDYNNTMQKYARIKSKDMGDNNYFSHEDLNGNLITVQMKKDGVSYRAWGENIAWMTNRSGLAQQFMTNWMNSSGHRANILSNNFSSIGIGVYKIGNRIYATQEFYR